MSKLDPAPETCRQRPSIASWRDNLRRQCEGEVLRSVGYANLTQRTRHMGTFARNSDRNMCSIISAYHANFLRVNLFSFGHSTCLRRLASIGARHAGGPQWMPVDEGGAGRCLLFTTASRPPH